MKNERMKNENNTNLFSSVYTLMKKISSKYFSSSSSNYFSNPHFHCNETRVIFITGVITLIVLASIAMKNASFSSPYTL